MDRGPPVTLLVPRLNQDLGSLGEDGEPPLLAYAVPYTARVCCTARFGHSFPPSVARHLEEADRVCPWVWGPGSQLRILGSVPQVTARKKGPGRARETPPPAAQGVFPAALALE